MDVRLPKIGDAAESGVVVSLLVKPGDTIDAGQTILEVENEKAIAPVPSPSAGRIATVHVKEGDTISAGAVLVTLESAPGAKADSGAKPTPPSKTASPGQTADRKTARKAALPPEDDVDDDGDVEIDESGTEESGHVPPPASPYVRKVARDLGIRLSKVRGSESGGRIVLGDLARYVARLERAVARAGRYAEEPKGLVFPPVSVDFAQWGPVKGEPLSMLRKVIASRMVESTVTLPHVTQFDDADMTAITALREKFKGVYEKAGAKLSPTPFIIKALVALLQQHARFNASLDEVNDKIILKQYYHIGIAVDTEAGLLVPVIRDCDKKSMLDLSKELASLAERARDRKILPDEMKGGSFTISNQGAIGSGHFTPVINKPEVAILGIGKSAPKPVVTAAGKIEARPMMPLTLSYDHRVIDGGGAARFMAGLVERLQNFPESDVKI